MNSYLAKRRSSQSQGDGTKTIYMLSKFRLHFADRTPARKSLLFNNEEPWVKKNGNDLFDVTMGCFDGAEICELVGLFILQTLGQKYNPIDLGLYRDDGLALFHCKTDKEMDNIRKDFIKIFKELDLRITIETNLKIVNFLDVTLDLNTGKFKPYNKPNNKPMYINNKSSHPRSILKQLPESIEQRISSISSDQTIFEKCSTTIRRSSKNKWIQPTYEIPHTANEQEKEA